MDNEEQLDVPFLYWEDDEYNKTMGQFNMQVGGYLQVFDRYGMGIYIPYIQTAIFELAKNLGMRLRGDDRPIKSSAPVLPRPTGEPDD